MRILLISPNFFDYPEIICKELRNMGHEVDWYDDRPSTNNVIKAIIRIKKDIINKYIKKYFDSLMMEIQNKKYDKVLLISGQSLSFSAEMLEELRDNQRDAEFVLYQWDSLKNFGYIKGLKKYFDRCYSFDRTDVRDNEYLQFLPLFYSQKYENIGKKNLENYKYDVMFVGTAHPKKYKYINEMSNCLKDKYKNQFIYFFFPSRLVYIYRRLKSSEFKNAKYSEFHFTPINSLQMDELLEISRCVFDSAQDGQTGLTIRVLETLGAKRKIITTNNDVVNYDFYCPENIYVYDGKFDFNHPFFNNNYVAIDEKIYEKYSLKNWLSILIGEY